MMKLALPAALLLFGVGLSGCPVYDSDDVGCYSDRDCANGYVCDDVGSCVATISNSSPTCTSPDDCGTNETCGRSGTCVTGDCHFSSVGCVNGYECSSASGRWECLEQGPGSSGGAPSGGSSSIVINGGAPAVSGGTPGISDGGASPGVSGAGAGG